MAKTSTEAAPPATQQDNKKQRKKQAKREAKLMLKIEQAKKSVHKAEQKAAKAQANLEDRRTYLHDLEGKLAQAHQQEPHDNMANGAEPQLQDNAVEQQQEQFAAPEEVAGAPEPSAATIYPSPPPVEGRSDVFQAQPSAQETNGATQDAATTYPSPPPVEGRSDIPQEEESSSPQEVTSSAHSDSVTEEDIPPQEAEQDTAPINQVEEPDSDTYTTPSEESETAQPHE
ncbi:MAG TPA: hypothetical protein VFB12_09430 [Ktedonobacteraceae bacterium]|nr:hypothetical protein [Ktedonobacteraceae bacterium]